MTYPLTKRMTLSGVASVLALTMVSVPAMAQNEAKKAEPAPPDCPPGAFCEEVPVEPPAEAAPEEGEVSEEGAEAPEEGGVEAGAAEEGSEEASEKTTAEKSGPVTVVLPPAEDPNKPRTFTYHPDPDGGPGQVVIYEDGDAPPHLDGKVKRVRKKVRRRKRLRRHRRWGMNLRVDGVLLPQYKENAEHDSGMAGLGLSLRYRPTPMFALDFAADFLGGIDSMGFERQEIPLALSAMLYANPRNVVQFYMFGGINWSFARVFSENVEVHLAEGTQDEYTYFGGHAGLGLEFRVSKLVGINVDGLGFIRTRTDDDGNGAYPEFFDPGTREASNSSGGGLLRAGVTFWW
jgi:hypothetical protein